MESVNNDKTFSLLFQLKLNSLIHGSLMTVFEKKIECQWSSNFATPQSTHWVYTRIFIFAIHKFVRWWQIARDNADNPVIINFVARYQLNGN